MKRKLMILGVLMIFLISCSPKKNVDSNHSKKVEDNEEIVEEVEEKVHYYSPYRGEDVEESDLTKPAYAIMLDNHPDARPQAGISEADILYEMKVEGDFTRYFAVFQQNYPDPVGPIRSARPYFVEEALGLGSIYVHWGGSEAGYQEIRGTKIPNIDGIAWEGTTFYRNKEVNKLKPHNGYSNFSLFEEKAKELGYELDKTHQGFTFDHSEDLGEVQGEMGDQICEKAILTFAPTYKVEVEYDSNSQGYHLIRDGEEVIDENNKEVCQFKNIILRVIPSRVAGPLGTLAMDNIGTGEGFYLSSGKIIPIIWSKDSKDSPMKYSTEEGQEIIFNPGKTYIATVNTMGDLDFYPQENHEEVEENTTDMTEENN
ncbi:MAG: DUF3048 domain-containing protein [Tissierellia bacterium]|nr:DUF3048 domain-containing protein [Tissierellia bacterium]